MPGQNFTASNGMEMVWVAPMKGWVGKYLVTQDEYQQVLGTNPSNFKGAKHPVEQVSWNDAAAYCQKLTEQDHLIGVLPANEWYSVPSDGQYDLFVGNASLDDAVTSHQQQRRSTENVGTLSPNQYGLYDTRGNVWEWCLDWYDDQQTKKVSRGGSWCGRGPDDLDFSCHNYQLTDKRISVIGFRCVVTLPSTELRMLIQPLNGKPQTITLLARSKVGEVDNYTRATFNFKFGVNGDEGLKITRNRWDLEFGNSPSRDTFDVSMVTDDCSRIKDLGALNWSDAFDVPALPAHPLPTREPNVKAIIGHMYVVHTKNRENDHYALFRVESLKPGQSVTISWKLVASPGGEDEVSKQF